MKPIVFENVSFRYKDDDTDTLENLSFTVNEGEFVTVIGSSGCGKSTLFRLMLRLEQKYSGRILVYGEAPEGSSGNISFMPQKDLLLPWRSILKNVMLPLEAAGVPKKERLELARQAIVRVGLEGCEDKLPSQLSGGMRQRASFARTVITGGRLLLLDEPFSALDSLTASAMQDWLTDTVAAMDKTVMMITHNPDEAMLLGTKVFLMLGEPVKDVFVADVSFIKSRADLASSRAVILKEQLIGMLSRNTTEGGAV